MKGPDRRNEAFFWIDRPPEHLYAMPSGPPTCLPRERPYLKRGTKSPRKPYKWLLIATHPGIDISRLCSQLRKVSRPNAKLHIVGATITGELFDQLTRDWRTLDFRESVFEPGWWAIPTNCERNARRISARGCAAAPVPSVFTIGFLAWPELACLCFEDGFHRPGLSSLDPEEPVKPFGSDYPWAARDLTRALWHGRLSAYIASEMDSIEFLVGLPIVKRMAELNLAGSPLTPEVYSWAIAHKNLEMLWLSWTGFEPDWSALRRLPKLGRLDAHCPALDDAQVAQILKSTRAWGIFNEEGTLTPSSLWLALETLTLEWWWAPASVFSGPIPQDLEVPEDRCLTVWVEFVGREPDFMQELRNRFPQVEWDCFISKSSDEE